MTLLTLFAVLGFAAPQDQDFVWYDPNHLLAGHWLILLMMTIVALLLIVPRSSTRPIELAREVFIVIPAVLLYDVARGMVAGREAEAVARATNLVDIERATGMFWEQAIQNWFLKIQPLTNFMNFTYLMGMWPVIVLIAIWLFFRHRDAYPLYRDAFLISGAIALVCYALLPVAPPRFVEELGFVDTVASQTQAYALPDAPLIVNQYAAMPSLHFGWVLLACIALIHRSNGIAPKLLGIYFPTAMFFSIIATGNHFILDAVAGAAVVLLGLALSYTLHSAIDRTLAGSPEPVPVLVSSSD
jgi:hypothetical protein